MLTKPSWALYTVRDLEPIAEPLSRDAQGEREQVGEEDFHFLLLCTEQKLKPAFLQPLGAERGSFVWQTSLR